MNNNNIEKRQKNILSVMKKGELYSTSRLAALANLGYYKISQYLEIIFKSGKLNKKEEYAGTYWEKV